MTSDMLLPLGFLIGMMLATIVGQLGMAFARGDLKWYRGDKVLIATKQGMRKVLPAIYTVDYGGWSTLCYSQFVGRIYRRVR